MSHDDCGHTHLAAAWVLGTLTAAEADPFAAHLAVCATCQAEVASLQEAADAMADAVPPVALPAGLRARLMAAVEQEADLFRAAGAHKRDPAKSHGPHRPLLRSALAVFAVLALVGGGAVLGGVLTNGKDRGSETRTIPGTVTEAGGGPGARAHVSIRNGQTRLVLSDIDRPPESRIYQAWVVRPPSRTIPTGALFSVGGTGDTTVILPALGDAERVIVTSEPLRGSTVPTLPPVAAVRLALRTSR